MQPTAATDALQTLIRGVLAGYGEMGGPANKLMWTLVTLEVAFVGIWTALGEEQVASLFKKVLGLGIWIWIVQQFPRLASALVEGLAEGALRAGGEGGDFRSLQDPSAIASQGLKVTKPFMDFIQTIPMLNVADKVAYYLCALAIIWMYIWMAWCVFYPMVEYYLFVAVGSLLMPFAINRHTRFIADKAIHMTVACGIKLMVLGFCLAIIKPVLSKIQFTVPITWNQLYSVLLTVGALGYLLYKAPQAAMSMVQGSPSLNGGEILSGLGRMAVSVVATAPVMAQRYLLGSTVSSFERFGSGALASSSNAPNQSNSATSVSQQPLAAATSASSTPQQQPESPKDKGADA